MSPGFEFIFEDKCLSSLKKVKKAYIESKLLKIYQYNGDANIKNYHPILGVPYTLAKLSSDEIVEVANLNKSNFSSKEKYALRSRLFGKLELSKSIFFDRDDYMMPAEWDPEIYTFEIECALELMKKVAPWQQDLFMELIDDIWLIWSGEKMRFYCGAATDYYYLGLMFMSLRPKSEFQIYEQVLALAHELGHTVLYYLQAGKNPIEDSSFGKWVYSGIRKTERPSYASLHAAIALGYMVYTASAIKGQLDLGATEREYLEVNVKNLESDLEKGIQALARIELTALGDVVVSDLKKLLRT